MVNVEYNSGKTYEVELPKGDKKKRLPSPDIYDRVREVYRQEQEILHPGVPVRLSFGERVLRKIIGERRREVRI